MCECLHVSFFVFTRSPSSFSSSCVELEGDGVADLLPGGDGELWATELPLIPSCDWLMVGNWLCWPMPDWFLGPSAASIGCWLLVNRESELTICCICVKRRDNRYPMTADVEFPREILSIYINALQYRGCHSWTDESVRPALISLWFD